MLTIEEKSSPNILILFFCKSIGPTNRPSVLATNYCPPPTHVAPQHPIRPPQLGAGATYPSNYGPLERSRYHYSHAPRVYNDVGHYSTVAATRSPSPQLEEAHIAPLPYRQRESCRYDQTLTNEELLDGIRNSALGTGVGEDKEDHSAADNGVVQPYHPSENQSDESDSSAHSTGAGESTSTSQPEEVDEEDHSADDNGVVQPYHLSENQSDQSDLSVHSTGAGESTCENQSDESEPQSKGDDQGEGYKLIKILTDPNRQCHYHDDCGNVAQSVWRDQANGSTWPYCEYCQKE